MNPSRIGTGRGVNERANRRPCLAFAWTVPLLAAAALFPAEFSHYKRWLELGTDDVGLRVALAAGLASKTLVATAIGGGLLALVAQKFELRSLRGLSLVGTLLLHGFLSADLELQKNTGNPLSYYLPFLFDSDTFVWAGKGFDVVPGFKRVLRNVLFALVPAIVVAGLIERWAQRGPVTRGRRFLLGLALFVLVSLVAAPLIQRSVGAPSYTHHLNERMPWTWARVVAEDESEFAELQASAQTLLRASLPAIRASIPQAQLVPDHVTPTRRPDILMIVVESLRHDALEPHTMPSLWNWAAKGLRAPNHYATSNASHYGLFAMLYGRSPLYYYETLEHEVAPPLPAQLVDWGYTTYYLTCADLAWRGMDHFLGPDYFAVERPSSHRLDECDQKVTSRTAQLLGEKDRAPRLILAFLMSTHFGYHYPEGAEPFRPASPPPNAVGLNAGLDPEALVNRYRNSAHHIDQLIGRLIDQLDHPEEKLILVTGDHGESLFDDGTIAHSSLLSEIQTRVPLVITGPGIKPGSEPIGPTDHTSLLPTLFARLGISSQMAGSFAGRDLMNGVPSQYVSLIQAKSRAGGRDRLALVSEEHRFSWRLDRDQETIQFLGELNHRGRPASIPLTTGDSATASEWIEHYLMSLTTEPR
jgi:membrane-anchored protein YejM (alkaline phosphatase superfamily)